VHGVALQPWLDRTEPARGVEYVRRRRHGALRSQWWRGHCDDWLHGVIHVRHARCQDVCGGGCHSVHHRMPHLPPKAIPARAK
jgi:hypothetical protein